MRSEISNQIKQCIVRSAATDAGAFPIVNITYHEKQTTAWHMTPYGVYSNPPAGSSAGIVFCVEGKEESRFAIVNTPYIRFDNLKENEVAFGNPVTGSNVHFKNDGSIEITGKNKLNVTIDSDCNVTIGGNCNVNVAGDCNLTATGDATINADNAAIIANTILLTDGLPGGGEDTLVRMSTLKGYIDGHMHSGVTTGSGNSGVPTVPLPGSVATTVVKAK